MVNWIVQDSTKRRLLGGSIGRSEAWHLRSGAAAAPRARRARPRGKARGRVSENAPRGSGGRGGARWVKTVT